MSGPLSPSKLAARLAPDQQDEGVMPTPTPFLTQWEAKAMQGASALGSERGIPAPPLSQYGTLGTSSASQVP